MKTDFKLLGRITLVFLLGVVMAGCASGPKDPSSALLQQIEAASTRSDHEALVSYYEREATGARTSAVGHRKMAQSYQVISSTNRGGASMQTHCNSLVSLYEGAATEYDGLAGMHRQLATSAAR
jgi:heterodisulfide reductase subunit A-like polyferredoxin